MGKIIRILIVAALCWAGYKAWHRAELARQPAGAVAIDSDDLQPEYGNPRSSTTATADAKYHCDGRKRCPEMHSCEEATWFIEHCPGMEMDGDGDGVPCERQWCQ